MKIIVCVKQVSLIVAKTGNNPATQFVSEEDRVQLINPYDLVGVEEALRIKESTGAEVVLLTLGPLEQEVGLKRCRAMGADQIYQIEWSWDNHMDHRGKARLLASAIQGLKADLVICGRRSVDSDGQQIGAWLAELLGMSYIPGAIHVELDHPQNELIIHRALERGYREIVHCKLPAVLAIEMGLNEPRYPTLPSTLWALNQEIPRIDVDKPGFVQDHAGSFRQLESLIELSIPRPRPRKVSAPDRRTSAVERMKQVMSGGLQGKEGKICRGSPEMLSRKIIDALKAKGFIKEVKKQGEQTVGLFHERRGGIK